MTRSARHFTNTSTRVDVGLDLQPKVWYRTPLSNYDHLIGLRPEFMDEGLAWCGFDLRTCRDWKDDEYGGLWYSNRKSNRCAGCKTRQGEYDSAQQ